MQKELRDVDRLSYVSKEMQECIKESLQHQLQDVDKRRNELAVGQSRKKTEWQMRKRKQTFRDCRLEKKVRGSSVSQAVERSLEMMVEHISAMGTDQA